MITVPRPTQKRSINRRVRATSGMVGRIIKGIGGFYFISHEGETIMCSARGSLKRGRAILYVGDIVEYDYAADNEFVITNVLERRNFLERPPLSNLDALVVTFAAANPIPNIYTIDKMCCGAEARGIDVIVCISKIDLSDMSTVDSYREIYEKIYPTVCVSSETGQGICELKEVLSGMNSAFAGASGVGKSTLINSLTGSELAETGDMSESKKRGKHTTRHVEIFELEGDTRIYDTPGFTSLDLSKNVSSDKLDVFFPDFADHKSDCKYSDCLHMQEPECGIKKALANGRIYKSRYESYKQMLREVSKWRK